MTLPTLAERRVHDELEHAQACIEELQAVGAMGDVRRNGTLAQALTHIRQARLLLFEEDSTPKDIWVRRAVEIIIEQRRALLMVSDLLHTRLHTNRMLANESSLLACQAAACRVPLRRSLLGNVDSLVPKDEELLAEVREAVKQGQLALGVVASTGPLGYREG